VYYHDDWWFRWGRYVLLAIAGGITAMALGGVLVAAHNDSYKCSAAESAWWLIFPGLPIAAFVVLPWSLWVLLKRLGLLIGLSALALSFMPFVLLWWLHEVGGSNGMVCPS
jgi:hypothetical protein